MKGIRRSDAQWRVLIEKYQRSGLTQAEFCRQNKLSAGNFSKHRNRLLALDNSSVG